MTHQPITVALLQSLVAESDGLRLSARARERLRWILFYAEHRESVSATCLHFGIARGTFHRWLNRFDPKDLSSLEEHSHAPATVRQSSVPAQVVALVRAYRERDLHLGKERIAELLASEHGVSLSASTVGRIIERECLYFDTTPHHWRKRLERNGGTSLGGRLQDSKTPIPKENPKAKTHVVDADAHAGSAQTGHGRASSCSECTVCRLKAFDWRPVLRSVVTVSLVMNLALVMLLLAGVLGDWQSLRTQATAGWVGSHAALDPSLLAPSSSHDAR